MVFCSICAWEPFVYCVSVRPPSICTVFCLRQALLFPQIAITIVVCLRALPYLLDCTTYCRKQQMGLGRFEEAADSYKYIPVYTYTMAPKSGNSHAFGYLVSNDFYRWPHARTTPFLCGGLTGLLVLLARACPNSVQE